MLVDALSYFEDAAALLRLGEELGSTIASRAAGERLVRAGGRHGRAARAAAPLGGRRRRARRLGRRRVPHARVRPRLPRAARGERALDEILARRGLGEDVGQRSTLVATRRAARQRATASGTVPCRRASAFCSRYWSPGSERIRPSSVSVSAALDRGLDAAEALLAEVDRNAADYVRVFGKGSSQAPARRALVLSRRFAGTEAARLSRIWSAVLCHANGFGLSLQLVIHCG
jgi:hypothetical protein